MSFVVESVHEIPDHKGDADQFLAKSVVLICNWTGYIGASMRPLSLRLFPVRPRTVPRQTMI